MKLSLGVCILFMLGGATASASETVTSGLYYFGHEVESFHPCGSKKEYWVDGPENVLAPLRARANRLRTKEQPYPPIYVHFVGHVGDKDTPGGFAKDYDAVYHAVSVRSVYKKIPSHCRPANPPVHTDSAPAALRR